MGRLYPDLDFDEQREAYEQALESSSLLAEKVASYNGEPVADNLRVFDYMLYEKRVNRLGFNYVPLDGKLASIFAGSLMVGAKRPGHELPYAQVGINSSMIAGRQHNTSMHEIMHYHFDVPNGFKGESFPNLLKQGQYSPEEQYREAVASFGASQLQIPTLAMIQLIRKGKDLEQGFSSQFASSYGANIVRLRSYLIYEEELYYEMANKWVEEYKANPLENRLRTYFLEKFSESDFLGVELNGDRSAQWDFDDNEF